jgi:hypothetical protein
MQMRRRRLKPNQPAPPTIDDDDPLNEPEDIGGKSPGSRVSREEASIRRAALDLLLVDGTPDEDIIEQLTADPWKMTRQHARELLKNAKARLQKHSDERKPLNRAMAERRLHEHITRARKRNQFAAVAQLEKQLSAIQGTEQTPEVTINLNARLTSAVMHVLGGMEPAQIQSVIVEEAARLPGAK